MRKTFTLLFVLLCTSLFAQTNPFSFTIYYQTTSTDTAVFDSLCNRICEVNLEDTTGIASIDVSVGTTGGGTDILNYSFAFDVSQNLPAGLGYSREGNKVKLILLQTTHSDLYYYSVQLHYSNGQYSPTRMYN
ncbi:MAG: hypothetical protein CVU14_06665 [Bacteroidetes bacterium HGW-Bacteroidetes-9]|jgi:hypothetical protein|nr:MAG: hypothetical protein CVU14_06665 [Bacteroidetes bacterium HGW-Bacteroidetes-9]